LERALQPSITSAHKHFYPSSRGKKLKKKAPFQPAQRSPAVRRPTPRLFCSRICSAPPPRPERGARGSARCPGSPAAGPGPSHAAARSTGGTAAGTEAGTTRSSRIAQPPTAGEHAEPAAQELDVSSSLLRSLLCHAHGPASTKRPFLRPQLGWVLSPAWKDSQPAPRRDRAPAAGTAQCHRAGGAWARHDQLGQQRCASSGSEEPLGTAPNTPGIYQRGVLQALRKGALQRERGGSSMQRRPVRHSHRLPRALPSALHATKRPQRGHITGCSTSNAALGVLQEQPRARSLVTEEELSDQSQATSRTPVRLCCCRTPSATSHSSCQDGDQTPSKAGPGHAQPGSEQAAHHVT